MLTQIRRRITSWLDDWRLVRFGIRVAGQAQPKEGSKPILFVNISSRLGGFSQNAAFTMLSAMGVQLAGYPVVYYVCQAGLSRCVLGTDRNDVRRLPPCKACMQRSKKVFLHAPTAGFVYQRDAALEKKLHDLSVDEMMKIEARVGFCADPLPLGRLTLPSLRWALRRFTLTDDEDTRFLFREYILSAYSLAVDCAGMLERIDPAMLIIFNGIMYPEAVIGWVGRGLGYRVVTHEVGFEPFSAFFSDGQATAYPIHIPDGWQPSQEQNARLDQYLSRRFQGDFTMAGIRFWKEMKGLDEEFLRKASGFRQVVAVFSNVIYDTSQIHANVVFRHMFHWLDVVKEIIVRHSETLFVIRAHPDEMRPGTRKQSRETVRAWAEENDILSLKNVVYIDSREYISSYQLIQHSKFVMVYNSSIGLEATLLGKAVICGGKARYTQYPIVFFPEGVDEYVQKAEEFLQAENAGVPDEYINNARRFLYYQLYRVSLPFGRYLKNADRAGFVRLRSVTPYELLAENSPAIAAVLAGVAKEKEAFMLRE